MYLCYKNVTNKKKGAIYIFCSNVYQFGIPTKKSRLFPPASFIHINLHFKKKVK